ncbi:hypothetical protein ACIQV3_18055 [Streptomyces sp. NPDC099050]|uniref:hypothetical protein n=1 Tax=Streptomyces sp. NPDC099050 TaxID=3366100 RepID=UPI0038257EDD
MLTIHHGKIGDSPSGLVDQRGGLMSEKQAPQAKKRDEAEEKEAIHALTTAPASEAADTTMAELLRQATAEEK